MINTLDLIKKAKKDDFVLTKFISLEERSMLNKIKDPTLKFCFYGGFDEAERTRCIIIPSSSIDASAFEFEIVFIKIKLYEKDPKITHRHVLGTIIALGIKREYLGDIIFCDDEIYVAADKNIAIYIKNNLTKICNTFVEVEINETSEFKIVIPEETKNINVASMRLDAIIARALNISRNASLEMIEKGLIQINHNECFNSSYNLKENDLISIRHYGRISVGKIVNTTKKNRLVVEIKIKH